MKPWLAPRGWLLVGECYWAEAPRSDVAEGLGGADQSADLSGTLDRSEEAGLDLVEMVLADPDGWDRYVARQWLNVADWLLANPDHPDAAEIRELRNSSRRDYLRDERRCLGWGVFVLREPS
jgi:hypothetical protein